MRNAEIVPPTSAGVGGKSDAGVYAIRSLCHPMVDYGILLWYNIVIILL
jgi:hypothetical protein